MTMDVVDSAAEEAAMKAFVSDAKTKEFLTVKIADQQFGISILQIQDVLRRQDVTTIPLAPPEVAGSLNLRGRIVTAINVRRRLGIDAMENNEKEMSVVVEHDGELYSLVIDAVGDVLALHNTQIEKSPATLDPVWREIAAGVCRLDDNLLVILDVPKLLNTVHN